MLVGKYSCVKNDTYAYICVSLSLYIYIWAHVYVCMCVSVQILLGKRTSARYLPQEVCCQSVGPALKLATAACQSNLQNTGARHPTRTSLSDRVRSDGHRGWPKQLTELRRCKSSPSARKQCGLDHSGKVQKPHTCIQTGHSTGVKQIVMCSG